MIKHPAQGFALRLRALREQRGLSQSDLAEKAGFRPSAISHFETGRREPSFGSLCILADALAVTIDYLAGRQDVDPATVGPAAERLFHHVSKLSDADRRTIEDFAKMLANKKRKP